MKPTYEQLEQQLAAVVAENAGLKSAFNPEDIPEDAVEAFTETAIINYDWDDTGSWSWVENDTDVIRAVLDALKPETPATDAYLAEVRAQVWSEAKALAKSAVASDSVDHIDFLFDGKAAQLRQGAEHE